MTFKHDHSNEDLVFRCFPEELEQKNEESNEIADMIVNLARKPDPSSEFAEKAGDLIKASDKQILEYLISERYGALFCHMNNSFLGVAAYQSHGEEDIAWKMFRVYVREDMQGKGYGTFILRNLVNIAEEKGVATIKLGQGGSVPVCKIYKTLAEEQKSLGRETDDSNYTLCLK